MDTELFDTFVHICKTRSFTKTAEAMCLTQAAISARVKQLESLIGYPVFIRCKNSHAVQLTKSGYALLPFASEFISNWEMIRKEINNIHDMTSLDIGIYPALINVFFDKILSIDDIEKFNLNINQFNNLNFIESVNAFNIDLFITLVKPKTSQYEHAYLGSNKIGMLYNHLVDGPVLSINWGDDINKKINIHSLNSNILKVDSPDFARNYILKNGGKCYLPLDMKIKQIKQDINYPEINVPIYAIFDKKKKNNAIELFIDTICP